MSFDTALPEAIDRAWAMMAQVGTRTADAPGITRPAWSPAEEIAADAVRRFAAETGLDVASDPYGNLVVTPAGQDAAAPAVTSGSHMDTVPHGGNFDGFAGVAAALAVVAAAQAAGAGVPLRAIAMRCEESPWFGTAYLGSRLLLGLSTLDELGPMVRVDSGETLAAHVAALGYPRAGEAVAPPLTGQNTPAFIEMHIEQGPLLLEAGVPVGIATSIRGNVRFPDALCRGEYAHSAALPRRFRRDAVLAVAELALVIDGYWAQRIDGGDEDFVATVGKFATDPAAHAMTKVAGEVAFSLNVGSTSPTVQDAARALALETIAGIEERRGVTFMLGEETGTPPTPIPPVLRTMLHRSAAAAGIAATDIPTVGHDAAMFARAGIPAAVVLVQNEGGSHNPDERLAKAPFAAGVTTIGRTMLEIAAGGLDPA
ncbi:M20/M25/M40 family metallo-hydrolase [Acuticoccus sp. I52.16.1]|uniref:M20/M25/M40 family metallo-hydrolase n=1 Tax=Acuticoccus sp. I52.16.1 TaxID=2928472 RepID=UPI001FD352AF|nr:M20/M25/M40 family metallo-hydrolase [Acuticoccus sp. I52.16.1]UOM33098.1 M20/M25/M40 family metallo-hydrolase [Acuticoccus sp. I52.16.1]